MREGAIDAFPGSGNRSELDIELSVQLQASP
jgi:hypothetical protein